MPLLVEVKLRHVRGVLGKALKPCTLPLKILKETWFVVLQNTVGRVDQESTCKCIQFTCPGEKAKRIKSGNLERETQSKPPCTACKTAAHVISAKAAFLQFNILPFSCLHS